MIIISHRGNTNGSSDTENAPSAIDRVIRKGFDVEVDVWFVEGNAYLGHDLPIYKVDFEWLLERKQSLWIHCKNIDAIVKFNDASNGDKGINYFWHNTDIVTLTSLNYVWAYPCKEGIENSIAVLPEMYDTDLSKNVGICTDFPEKYALEFW